MRRKWHDIRMSFRRKWLLIGALLLLVILAYWMDRKYPFPPLLRNKEMATTHT
jgi:hypothetical protein